MKQTIWIVAALCLLLSGCATADDAQHSAIPPEPFPTGSATASAAEALTAAPQTLPDALLASYYLPAEDPVFSYLQNNSIQGFFAMWLEEAMDGEAEGHWDYDTLAPVLVLDHDFAPLTDPETALYTCMFTTDDGACGYIIVSYSDDGPHIQKWSLHETTPYFYDLRAYDAQIAAALNATDIDLSTATATRVEWIETDKNRGDRIILFADGKGDRYVCYLGDDDFSLEKQ